jgi:membrane protein implicated in regulation of membrane protease activity
MTSNDHEQYRERDAASLLMMGAFFLMMGMLLLLASTWSFGDQRPFTVTLSAAIALLLIGAIMIWRGRVTKAGGPASDTERSDGERGDT